MNILYRHSKEIHFLIVSNTYNKHTIKSIDRIKLGKVHSLIKSVIYLHSTYIDIYRRCIYEV